MDRWNVGDAADWGRVLGLVPVPLFGEDSTPNRKGGHVLLDGQPSSFTFIATEDSRDLLGNQPLEWSWSAFLNHAVIADVSKGLIFLRRWDAPDTIRRFHLPTTPHAASQLFDIVRTDRPVTHTDVILHLLRAFRAIRSSISSEDNALESLRLFNALILSSKAVADGVLKQGEVLGRDNVGGVIRLLESLPETYTALLEAGGAIDLSSATRGLASQVLVSWFIDSESQFRYTLEPNLLMRHASGQLYQEAHLALERQSFQPSLFPGLDEASTRKMPPARSDVRFTPVALARSLVQQAIKALGSLESMPSLDILDPACGSAVFLLQVIQELVNRKYRGKVTIRGYDLSPISCVMARFCLEHARQDAAASGLQISYSVEPGDALERDWGHPDIVLMNPPFIHVDRMGGAELETVRRVLGSLDKGRSDKAMAFAWKAFQSIRPGGVVSTVLPAPLLETSAGDLWRKALADEAQLTLLGCFRGYGYFKGTKVEPAFLVIRKPPAADVQPNLITIVVATDGAEDRSLRALRQDQAFSTSETENFEVYRTQAEEVLQMPTWTPRSKSYRNAMESLKDLDIPTVGNLFDVQQGALTGLNTALIIPEETYLSFKTEEQRYFRPIAATSTIRNGRLTPKSYVFYPYNAGGLTLTTEDQVKKAVPRFYRDWLLPNMESLCARKGIPESTWWRLTREREGQREPRPKLVTAYFGQRGNFAFDESGQYVVTQGYAWFWRRESSTTVELEDPADIDSESPLPGSFYESPLPMAYLALLNSEVFERFLSFSCPIMQGGQLNLSIRYVANVRVPDLSGDVRSTKDMVKRLARIGRAIHAGGAYDLRELNQQSARAYQMPLRDILSRDV